MRTPNLRPASILFAAVLTVLTLAVGTAPAVQPGQETNPNGFPSGSHYNLNIHGKKSTFSCPAVQYDEFGNPLYGNSIFVPEYARSVRILMQSGRVGSKAAAITELQAIDACAAQFDGDEAVIQLPPNANGYRVYARALAKPTGNPTFTAIPGLLSVQDELGNDLIYLGLVTSGGFSTPYATFTRSAGKSKAVDITGLFEWTGEVCYLTQAGCTGTCTSTPLCCTDADLNGIYESCSYVGDLGCPSGTIPVTSYCQYYAQQWVFNIGDFVTYFWDVTNDGTKLLQVRFYPVQ